MGRISILGTLVHCQLLVWRGLEDTSYSNHVQRSNPGEDVEEDLDSFAPMESNHQSLGPFNGSESTLAVGVGG